MGTNTKAKQAGNRQYDWLSWQKTTWDLGRTWGRHRNRLSTNWKERCVSVIQLLQINTKSLPFCVIERCCLYICSSYFVTGDFVKTIKFQCQRCKQISLYPDPFTEFESLKVLKIRSNELSLQICEKFPLPAFCIKKLINKEIGVWWESIDTNDMIIKKLRIHIISIYVRILIMLTVELTTVSGINKRWSLGKFLFHICLCEGWIIPWSNYS